MIPAKKDTKVIGKSPVATIQIQNQKINPIKTFCIKIGKNSKNLKSI
jgi:hypothetical protein